MVIITVDIRRTYNIGNLTGCIITQSIRSQCKLRIYKFHIIIKNRLFSSRTILSPFRSQHVFFIHQRTAIEIITKVINTVIVQTIGQQCSILVLHAHIIAHLGYLCVSIIKKIIPIQKQRISLHHFYIIKSLQRIGIFIKAGTVTIHINTIMAKSHISNQYLCIRVRI